MTHKRFFIITFQHMENGRPVVNTRAGYNKGIPEDHTEHDIFLSIRKVACDEEGIPIDNAAVLFYYLGKPEVE